MAKKQINNAINKESMFKKIMPSAAHAVVKPSPERKKASEGAEDLSDDLMDDLIEQSVGSFGDDLLEQLPSSRRIFAAPAAPTAPVPPPPAAAPEPPEGYLIGSPDQDEIEDSPPTQKSQRATPRARARQAAQHAQQVARQQAGGQPQADFYPEQQPYAPYPPQSYYPQQPYPQQSYPQQPYPQQPYPQQPYPQQPYPQQPYPQQPYPQQPYPQQPYYPPQQYGASPPYSPEQPGDGDRTVGGAAELQTETPTLPEGEAVHPFQPVMDLPSDVEEPEDYDALPPLHPESEDIVNITELIVLSHLDDAIERMSVCTCEKCRMDIAAYALNHLTAQYILSEELDEETLCRRSKVATAVNALYRAAIRVKTFPRHDL